MKKITKDNKTVKKVMVFILMVVFTFGTSSIGMAVEKVTVCGTGDSQELLRILAGAFEKANKDTEVEVPDSIGSSGGIRATAEGKCDLGRVARKVKKKEEVHKLKYRLFAHSPVVLVANQSVTGVENLSTEQIIAIFSGKIAKWSDLGGKEADIYVANREAGDSSRKVMEKYLPGFKDIDNYTGETLYSTPENIETISKYENTIGYGPLAMVKGQNLKVMKINGVLPSMDSVHRKAYTLLTPFGLVWKDGLKGTAKGFLDYLGSPEAEKIILQNGGIPAH